MSALEVAADTVADAEKWLLGAAMSGYRDLDALLDAVAPGDFYSPFHEDVWVAVARVHRAGNKPDSVSVRLALSEAQVQFEPLLLHDYTQAVPIVGNAAYYARVVANAAGVRRIQQAGIALQQLADLDADLDEIREQARARVDEATRGKSATQARTLADILPDVVDTAQSGKTLALGTPWKDLDRLIGGMAPGRLVIIGARPGVGKSISGTNLALHMAHEHQHAVLLCSMEMGEIEVGQRLVSAHGRIDLGRLQSGNLGEADWEDLAGSMAEIGALPITVDDAPSQTLTHIRRKARNVQRTRDDLALIVVDYLQLMTPGESRRDRNRVGELTEISRGLKLLARETGSCVVAMAQLNRGLEHRSDKRPTMSDLRESGSIENDADQVILMHVPDEEMPDLEFVVDKNRHGPKGVATVARQYHHARLASLAWNR